MARHQNVCPHVGEHSDVRPSPAAVTVQSRASRSRHPSSQDSPSPSVAPWPDIRMSAHMWANIPMFGHRPQQQRSSLGPHAPDTPHHKTRPPPPLHHGQTSECLPTCGRTFRCSAIARSGNGPVSGLTLQTPLITRLALPLRCTMARHQNVCPHVGDHSDVRPSPAAVTVQSRPFAFQIPLITKLSPSPLRCTVARHQNVCPQAQLTLRAGVPRYPSSQASPSPLRCTVARHQNVCPQAQLTLRAGVPSNPRPRTDPPPSVAPWPDIRMSAHRHSSPSGLAFQVTLVPGLTLSPPLHRGQTSECLPTGTAHPPGWRSR